MSSNDTGRFLSHISLLVFFFAIFFAIEAFMGSDHETVAHGAMSATEMQMSPNEVAEEGESSTTKWSSTTKTYSLISIVLLSVFLAARTFRNKPEA